MAHNGARSRRRHNVTPHCLVSKFIHQSSRPSKGATRQTASKSDDRLSRLSRTPFFGGMAGRLLGGRAPPLLAKQSTITGPVSSLWSRSKDPAQRASPEALVSILGAAGTSDFQG